MIYIPSFRCSLHRIYNHFKVTRRTHLVTDCSYGSHITVVLAPLIKQLFHPVTDKSQMIDSSNIPAAKLIKDVTAFAMHQLMVEYHRQLFPAIALHRQHNAAPKDALRSWRYNSTLPIQLDPFTDMKLFFYPRKLSKHCFVFLRYIITAGFSSRNPSKQADTYLSACQENPARHNNCHQFAQASRRRKVHLPDTYYLQISVAHRKLHPDVTDWQHIQQTNNTKQ